MDFWYPTCAAVFNDLNTPFIMSASLLRTHSMQISYADSPGPTVTLEQGKRFPFLNHVQVGNENGKMLYPKWELIGDFSLPQPIAANDCQNVLLQAGDQGPEYSGTTLDQGGWLPNEGGQPTQGGHTRDRSHEGKEGEVECEGNPPVSEDEFEHVCQVLNLVENWSERPARDVAGHKWSMRCVENVVVQPGTTQRVRMRWPVLSTNEFVELSQGNMLFEVCADEAGMKGGRDASNTQLVGGIGPLRWGQQAESCVNMLFRNPGEKTLTILEGDVLGYARLAGQGHINPEWYRSMAPQGVVHSVEAPGASNGAASPERTQQLVEQLGISNNRLLAQHPEVRSKLIELVSKYEAVFTDADTAVGKTDLLKMRIVLKDDVVPVRAAVRKIKPGHQESLRKQIDSWLHDGVIAPAVSPWGSPLVPVAKKDGTTRWAVDYRELNKSTLPDAYPTPCLSHIVESLAGSKVFSSLDAAQAFHNVPIEEDSQDATAVVCM